MDNATLEAAFHAHTKGATKLTRRMVIHLADMAGMRPMSMVWRLEKMGLVKCGSWEWFKDHGGIRGETIAQVRREAAEMESE